MLDPYGTERKYNPDSTSTTPTAFDKYALFFSLISFLLESTLQVLLYCDLIAFEEPSPKNFRFGFSKAYVKKLEKVKIRS